MKNVVLIVIFCALLLSSSVLVFIVPADEASVAADDTDAGA